jgi:uncharacterized membrane protein
MKKLSTLFIAAVVTLLPSLVFAQGFVNIAPGNALDIGGVFQRILNILNGVVPVLIAAITVFLVFRAVQFAFTGDETTKKTAQNGMIQAGIALIVVLGFWGILAIIRNSLGLTGGTVQVQTQNIVPFQ